MVCALRASLAFTGLPSTLTNALLLLLLLHFKSGSTFLSFFFWYLVVVRFFFPWMSLMKHCVS